MKGTVLLNCAGGMNTKVNNLRWHVQLPTRSAMAPTGP